MFERLTAPSEAINSITLKALCESCGEDACGDLCTEYLYKECKGCPVQEAFNRLAAYEDIEKSPEDIISSLEDYKDVSQQYANFIHEMQPLKEAKNLIGKTVYCAFAGVKKIMRSKIHGFEANSDRTVLLAKNGKKDYYLADISAVGKTVFLTREEAEKAIAEVVGE